jgi:hypothetical protein
MSPYDYTTPDGLPDLTRLRERAIDQRDSMRRAADAVINLRHEYNEYELGSILRMVLRKAFGDEFTVPHNEFTMDQVLEGIREFRFNHSAYHPRDKTMSDPSEADTDMDSRQQHVPQQPPATARPSFSKRHANARYRHEHEPYFSEDEPLVAGEGAFGMLLLY